MGEKKISINKTVIINFLSIILVQGISFLTAPIFLRLLGADQYGVFALFTSRVSILSCFMGFGVSSALAVSRYDFKDEYFRFRSSTLLLATLLSAIPIIIAVIFVNPISSLFRLSPFLTILVFVSAFCIFVSNFASSAFAYEKTPIRHMISAVSISLLNVGITFFFFWLLSSDDRYLARIYGYAFSHIGVAVVLWLFLFFKSPTWLNKRYNIYALKIGFPMIFHVLSNSVLIQSDRLMMQHMNITNSEIGIYTAYYSLASLLTVILTALNTSWAPYYFDDLKSEKWEDLKKKTNRYLELFTVLMCGFLLLSREVALAYCGEGYASGIDVLPILALATFFIFMYQFPVNFEIFHKKTKIVAIGTISAATANILLNLIGIKLWGMYGASIATVVSYALLFIAHYIISRNLKDNKFHMQIKDYLPWLTACMAAFAIFYLLGSFWYIRWALGLLLGVFELIRIKKRRSLFYHN